MNKNVHKERFFQPVQSNIKQFKITVTFLTGYNGFFNVTHPKKTNSLSQSQLLI